MKKVLLVLVLVAAPAAAAERHSLPAVALHEAAAVPLGGTMDEAVWTRVPAVSGFRQRAPRDGEPATFETEVRVAYDASALYVAVDAFDPEPDRVVGIRTRRDEASPSDWIRVLIDSFHDRRSAYEFSVNPARVKQDAYWYNDGQSDQGWDAVWDVAVSRTPAGWRARFRIPFSQLRFRPGESTTFGFAVVRHIARLNETTTWPLLSTAAKGYVSSFGELTGLRLAGSAKRLELVPYAVADVATRPPEPGNPLAVSSDAGAAAGLDLKYALNPGVTLTGTINPDFGQVEADPAVVNLSGFETFFAERRPFFVEGSGTFRFDLDCNDGQCSGLFYSRRIGRAPRGAAVVPGGGHAVAPAQTTILGAAKVTGRAAGFSLGVLNAVTASEGAAIAVGESRTRQTVEPLTNYAVARATRELGDGSSVGFMATSTNRGLDEATRFLPAQAQTGGVDWDWRLGRRYAVRGYWAGSTVRGSQQAILRLQESTVHAFQRPDAGHVELDPSRTVLNGHSANLSFSRIAGGRVRFNTNVSMRTPGFDANDVGFLRRADQRSVSNWLQIRRDRPWRFLRSVNLNLNGWAGWNFDGDRLYAGGNVNGHAMFTSNWRTGFGVNVTGRGFDDRATRGGPGAYRNGQRGAWGYVNTDERRSVAAGLDGVYFVDGHGTSFRQVNTGIRWRPSSFLFVSTGIRYGVNVDDAQWVAPRGPDYVFARLHQETVAVTARLNYTITPTLSVQAYAEPFVSAGAYTAFKRLVDGRAPAHGDRYEPVSYPRRPDFNYRSFRATNVLRWEYRPGSTLFVVWQQGRESSLDRGGFDFRRDFGGVFDAPARNVFLAKLAYWLNM